MQQEEEEGGMKEWRGGVEEAESAGMVTQYIATLMKLGNLSEKRTSSQVNPLD